MGLFFVYIGLVVGLVIGICFLILFLDDLFGKAGLVGISIAGVLLVGSFLFACLVD